MADHPVKVPAGLVQQWTHEATEAGLVDEEAFANRAAQWGADQELEAVEHWLITGPYGASIAASAPSLVADLRAARRPKPPPLAERALDQYDRVEDVLRHHNVIPAGCIRAALNRLAELEAQQ